MSIQNQNQQEENQYPNFKHTLRDSLDFFTFIPVPKTHPVSTSKSFYASLLMFLIFLFYIIFNLITFITNNAPRVNFYKASRQDKNAILPDIAFAFFFGEPFEKTINDPNIFSFSMDQITKFEDVTKSEQKKKISLVSCRPDWIPDLEFDLLCPNETIYMSGALYQTDKFEYGRIKVNYCKGTNCLTGDELAKITSGGRILLFIQSKGPNIDLTTGEPIQDIPYQSFQFFLIPGLYPRAFISFIETKLQIDPDLLRRFQVEKHDYIQIHSVDSLMTNVSVYNAAPGYQIQFKVTIKENRIFLIYSSSLDEISKYGAFWGVLYFQGFVFAGFAAYFLRYNRNKFYKNNKKWDNFGEQVKVKPVVDPSVKFVKDINIFHKQDKKKEQEEKKSEDSEGI